MDATLAEVTTDDGHTYTVCPAGFPAERCPKCAGRGTIAAYANVHHGACYRCNTAGYLYPRTVAGNIARAAIHARVYTDAAQLADAVVRSRAAHERLMRRRAARAAAAPVVVEVATAEPAIGEIPDWMLEL